MRWPASFQGIILSQVAAVVASEQKQNVNFPHDPQVQSLLWLQAKVTVTLLIVDDATPCMQAKS